MSKIYSLCFASFAARELPPGLLWHFTLYTRNEKPEKEKIYNAVDRLLRVGCRENDEYFRKSILFAKAIYSFDFSNYNGDQEFREGGSLIKVKINEVEFIEDYIEKTEENDDAPF